MPGYQKLREKHTFLDLCRTPELAARVSLEPYELLGVDAVIVFSDILVVAEAMGLALEVTDAGPVLESIEPTQAGIDRLRDFDPERETGYVLDAIRMLVRALGSDVPVIGFSGAPWTLVCYMLGGAGAANSAHQAKQLAFSQPAVLAPMLEKIALATGRYLAAQIRAGAAMVQLFDTWAGELGRPDYERFALPATRQAIEQAQAGAAPVALYARGSAHLLESMARSGATVLSLDWRADLADARRLLGPKVALQGNVDPHVLLGSAEQVERSAREAIAQTGGRGHILNLGHGLLPQTPVGNAQAFVRAAHDAPILAPAGEP